MEPQESVPQAQAPESVPERAPFRLRDHAATIVSAVIALGFLGLVPQVQHVLFQMPGLGEAPEVVTGYLIFWLLFGGLTLWLLFAVSPERRSGRILSVYSRFLAKMGPTFGFGALLVGGLLLYFRGALAFWIIDAPFLGVVGGLYALAGVGALLARGSDRLREVAARALGAVGATVFFGEVIWMSIDLSGEEALISPRAFTMWGMLELGFLAVLAGRTLDLANRELSYDPRPWAALVVVILSPMDEREPFGSSALPPAHPDEWVAALEARLAELPDHGPVVVIAASGGGSRAALYASLVLDALNHRPIEPGGETTFADHLLILSGVSGGSLACAWQATHGRQPPREELTSTVEEELSGRLVDFVRGAMDRADQTRGRVKPELFERVLETCQQLQVAVTSGSPLPNLPVPFRARFADDMSRDHMAPVLRGLLLPGLGRGEALVDTWDDAFGWSDFHNGDWPSSRPLLLLGATHAQRGQRLVIGFPRLGDDWLAREPDSLAQHDPSYSLTLAEGVRLSAGFPWLMPVARLDVPTVDMSGTSSDGLHVVDGGVVDNTGMDTLVGVFSGLNRLAGAGDEPGAARARRVLAQLNQRGVLLVEIDSGAKKRSLSAGARWLPGVEAVETLQIAMDANAVRAAQAGVNELSGLLTRDSGESALTHVVFSADLFADVMTAWALGPADKAAIWGSFLFGFPSTWDDLCLSYWYHRRQAGESMNVTEMLTDMDPATAAMLGKADAGWLQARLDLRAMERSDALSILGPSRRGAQAVVESDLEQAAPKFEAVLVQPARGTGQRVFFEYAGGQPLDLAGWKLRRASGDEVDLAGRLEPGGVGRVSLDGNFLPVIGERIELIDPNGRVVDDWKYRTKVRGEMSNR